MIKTTPQNLYRQDLVAWYEDTVAKLKAGDFQEIDIDSLIEEIEGLAGRDRRELESRLEVLLTHLRMEIYFQVSQPRAIAHNVRAAFLSRSRIKILIPYHLLPTTYHLFSS